MATLATIDQNDTPVHAYQGRTKQATLSSAITSKVGVGATEIFDAGTNGSVCQIVNVVSKGANPATVFRIFFDDGVTRTLLFEGTLAATTLSETAAQAINRFSLGMLLKSGEKLFAAIGTAGTDGWAVVTIGGDL
jgi:hypothetical protein